jgi:hypothetical protein
MTRVTAGIRRFGTGFPGDSELRGRELLTPLVLRFADLLDSRFSRRFSGVGKRSSVISSPEPFAAGSGRGGSSYSDSATKPKKAKGMIRKARRGKPVAGCV